MSLQQTLRPILVSVASGYDQIHEADRVAFSTDMLIYDLVNTLAAIEPEHLPEDEREQVAAALRAHNEWKEDITR